MESNLRQIKVEKPDEEVIAAAKELLRKAEADKIIGFAACTVNREKIVSNGFFGDMPLSALAFSARDFQIRVDDMIRAERIL
jgi:hypothetical protein